MVLCDLDLRQDQLDLSVESLTPEIGVEEPTIAVLSGMSTADAGKMRPASKGALAGGPRNEHRTAAHCDKCSAEALTARGAHHKNERSVRSTPATAETSWSSCAIALF